MLLCDSNSNSGPAPSQYTAPVPIPWNDPVERRPIIVALQTELHKVAHSLHAQAVVRTLAPYGGTAAGFNSACWDAVKRAKTVLPHLGGLLGPQLDVDVTHCGFDGDLHMPWGSASASQSIRAAGMLLLLWAAASCRVVCENCRRASPCPLWGAQSCIRCSWPRSFSDCSPTGQIGAFGSTRHDQHSSDQEAVVALCNHLVTSRSGYAPRTDCCPCSSLCKCYACWEYSFRDDLHIHLLSSHVHCLCDCFYARLSGCTVRAVARLGAARLR